MQLSDVLTTILVPTLTSILPASKFDSRQARVQLLAIGLQESRFETRQQIGGPARSFWQEELNGIKAVMHHSASSPFIADVCAQCGVAVDANAIYAAIATNDLLGCSFARLLLWTDPHPLPAITDPVGGWNYYNRNWRPGKPRWATWSAFWEQAVEATA